MNPDRLAALEEERRFLLGSIRDLDREFAAGDVAETDHRVLRDGYVARAAAVLREIEDGRSRLPERRRWSWPRRGAVVLGTLTFGVLSGVALAQFSGTRQPGQSMSGGTPVDEVTAQLASAREALTTGPVGWQQAAELYDKVLDAEPDNVEAQTYLSWLKVLLGSQASDAELVQAGVDGLHTAIEMDDAYPDAQCMLGGALANFADPPDMDGAKAAAEACLALDPPAEMADIAESLLARLAVGG